MKDAVSAHYPEVTSALLTAREVAALLKLSPSTVARLQRMRVLPFVKVGRSVRFRKIDVERALARRTIQEVS
jgi:excisionase family DNA binding protein